MSLMIRAAHSVTLESDQWEHKSTDWDVNIWRPSDIMAPVASGFFPRHVRVEQGERRQEASGRAFQNHPSHLSHAIWSRNHTPPFLHPHLPSHLPQLSPSCYTQGNAGDPLSRQLGLTALSRRTNLTVYPNTLWHNSKGRNHRNLHWYFFPKVTDFR